MPFCPKCGKEVSSEATYCFNCGQSLAKIQSVPIESKTPEAPTIKKEVPPPPKTHSTRNFAIVALVVIVVVAAMVVFLYDPNIFSNLGSSNAPRVSIQTIDSNPQAYVGKM
jgi:uncharacterized membrane protein YvbJ